MMNKALKTLIPIVLGLLVVVSVAFAGMKSETISTYNGTMKFFTTSQTVTNSSTVSLPNATNGLAWISDGTNTSLTHVAADASLVEIAESGTVEVSDTGSTLAIIDNGTQAIVKNKSGSNSTVTIIYQYVP